MGPIDETIRDLVQECYANRTLKETDRLEILETVMIHMANMLESDRRRVAGAMLGDYIRFARIKRKRK
jgi:ATP-dependent helicase YprA (DUF1998 family)